MRRDRLAIGVMMDAGLRREEAAILRCEGVSSLGVAHREKQNERTVLDMEGWTPAARTEDGEAV